MLYIFNERANGPPHITEPMRTSGIVSVKHELPQNYIKIITEVLTLHIILFTKSQVFQYC